MNNYSIRCLRVLTGIFSLCGFLISDAFVSAGSTDSPSEHSIEAPSEIGNHGMLVLGGREQAGNIYISHLPMFMPPHHFQGIGEVTFGESGDTIYRQKQQAVDRGGKPFYSYFTLKPNEDFLLRNLEKAEASFRADVFAGHFERSPQPPNKILSDVEVTIKNKVFFQELGEKSGSLKFAEYIIFGTPEERFLAHRITLAPNYDQIIQISSDLPENIIEGTVILGFAQDDAPDRALTVGQNVEA